MARILIAWEMGEAFGHLARCMQLALGLHARGNDVSLVLKDVRLPTTQGLVHGITVLPAPLTPSAGVKRSQPINYADVLRMSGFMEAQDIHARLKAWQGILALTQPDALVADYAPTALLAAHIAGIPHLAIGNGFTIPPDVSPWPSIRPWEDIAGEELIRAETQLDYANAQAQKMLGYSKAVRMRDLFGTQDILDTFAELDHYGARAEGTYIGGMGNVPQAMRVDWQSQSSRKVLAYLRPSVPGFMTMMQALSRLDAEVLCIAPGVQPELAKRLATRRLRIALAAIDLPHLLEQADLAVGYGNSGFTTQALLAGIPLLMRPKHVEQALFAGRVEALEAGKLLSGKLDASQAFSALQTLLEEPSYRQAAQTFKSRYQGFSAEQALEQSLLLIERLLP